MIAGATRGRGGGALIKHLLSNDHQISKPLPARGLISESFSDQVAELVAISAHGRTDKPVYHVHVDPPPGFEDDKIFDRYLALFEAEFGLADQPRVAVEHIKNGRRHRHFAWSLVEADGRIIDIGHDYARREKISRIIELEFGMPFVGGRHNRSVMKALSTEGRLDVVEAMLAAGLGGAERPVAETTPAERHQQERSGIKKKDVEARAFEAWTASIDGEGFAAELRARGLLLAAGDEGPVLVDMRGGVHSLTRVIGRVSKQIAGERIKAAVVKARVAGLALDPVVNVRPQAAETLNEPVSAPTPDRGSNRMKERLSAWLKSQKTARVADAQQAIELPAQSTLTREEKIAAHVLQVKLNRDYLHADNQLAARLHFVAAQAQIRAHKLAVPPAIPADLAAQQAELGRQEAIKTKYVIERAKYNEDWKAHWKKRPLKLNYFAYARWHAEAVQIDKERKGLGRQLAKLNPAVGLQQAKVRQMEADFAKAIDSETRRRQPAIERLRHEAEVLIEAANLVEQRGMRTASVEQIVELMQEVAEEIQKQREALTPEAAVEDEHAEIARETEEDDGYEYRPRI